MSPHVTATVDDTGGRKSLVVAASVAIVAVCVIVVTVAAIVETTGAIVISTGKNYVTFVSVCVDVG